MWPISEYIIGLWLLIMFSTVIFKQVNVEPILSYMNVVYVTLYTAG